MTPTPPESEVNTQASATDANPTSRATLSARLGRAAARASANLTPKTLSMVALAGLTAAALTTAAMAERGPGPIDGPEGHGPFSMQNFDLIDADKDGKITQVEIDAFRKAEVASADANSDGFMTADELAAMHLKQLTARAQDMAAKMVERLDADSDGKLSAAEMAARPMPDKLFARVDTDADGAITKDEAQAAADRMADMREGGHGPRKHRHGNN